MFNLLRLFLVLTVCLSWQMVMGATAPKVSVAFSNTPEYTKGQVLTENTKIDLKKGDELTLQVASSSVVYQQTFKGPYSDSKLAGLIKTIKEIIKPKRSGGPKKSGKEVDSQTRERMMKNPNLLIATEDEHFCYNAKKHLKFWRPTSQKKINVVITEETTLAEAEQPEIWKAKENTLDLSVDKLPKGGTSYLVEFEGTKKSTSLHKMPNKFDSNTYKWMWMVKKGCERQADILISKRVASQ